MKFGIPGGDPIEVPDEDWDRTPDSVKNAFVALQNAVEAMGSLLVGMKQRLDKLEGKSKSGKPGGGTGGSLPNRGKQKDGNKRGGQPGHPGKHRTPFPKNEVDRTIEVAPESCQHCGHGFDDTELTPYFTHQVLELLAKPFEVSEWVLMSGCCPSCDKVSHGELPPGVPTRNFGPRFIAALSLMSGVLHMSRRDIVEFVGSVWGVNISLGTVSSLEGLVTDAIRGAHSEVHATIQSEETAGADDTGWRQNNQYACLWVFTSQHLTYYQITADKSAESAAKVLGKFNGVLTSDRAKNLDFFKGWRQTCWAHLDRHFLAISERSGIATQVGLDAMAVHDQVSHIWHRFKNDLIDADQLFDELKAPREELEAILQRGADFADSRTASTCRNLLGIYDRLWTFSYHDGVEPTNNASEQRLRGGVQWRDTSYGSQSERGTRFAESIMTVAATCRQQGRSVLRFLEESVLAFLKKIPGPSLNPDPAPT